MNAASSNVGIVTDTTATLAPGFAAAHMIEVVPQIIIFGQESLKEDVGCAITTHAGPGALGVGFFV